MTHNHTTIATQGLLALHTLFGDEEPTIVILIDENEQLLGYEIRPLADVVADLVLNGFGDIAERNA